MTEVEIVMNEFVLSSNKSWSTQEQESLKTDIGYILFYAKKSQEHFINFHCWHLNFIQIIGIESKDYFALLEKSVNQTFLTESQKKNIQLGLNSKHPQPFSSSQSSIEDQIVDFHIHNFAFIDEYAGHKYRSKIKADLEKHLTFLDQSINASSDVLWLEYLNWLDSVLTSVNIKTITLIRFLATMSLILNHENQPKEKISLLNKGILHLIRAKKESINPSKQENSLLPEAKKYLEFLINADRKSATDLIFKLLDEEHWSIKDVYIKVFQESQYEIGRLWEKNKVSVAQEHFCTATTQMIMSILYPRLFSVNRLNKSVIATCVGSELHEIGIRMVSDFLEMEGWDTYYIGANAPTEAVVASLKEHKADLLAISVTLTPHVSKAIETIKEVRKLNNKVKIMVGGYPFIQDPELYQKVGADGVALSAENIHEIAYKIVSQ